MAQIFMNEGDMKSEEMQEPIIVTRMGEEIKLSDEEKEVLSLGPKFCILNNLYEEEFEREIEECIVKFRWKQMKNEGDQKERDKFGEEAVEAINLLFD